jgi:hypothetical protein
MASASFCQAGEAPDWLQYRSLQSLRFTMSAHNDTHTSDDPVENVVKHIPVVIPAAGAVLIFLLAFIAVFMA